MRAPVRIADAAVAGLLHPGDRVDVLAGSRVVAAGVRVVSVPETAGAPTASATLPEGAGPGGALVVLAVSRHTAASLAGAAMSSALAVALC
ncbi:RcpC/CpaB family pilus assembly protein [Streptomyces sp. NBC_01476]|uniref:RcpC/CpaB family pilus assembly protein n=1 Tax=Streptomyces sp. NBC_01476 TaxID=2903881 RepID=UPI002E3195C5|nr:RcpC/CpaB family pilus assembly protein [Streptomyces sp. NBC_01476]